jgi:hypothetical protein
VLIALQGFPRHQAPHRQIWKIKARQAVDGLEIESVQHAPAELLIQVSASSATPFASRSSVTHRASQKLMNLDEGDDNGSRPQRKISEGESSSQNPRQRVSCGVPE